MSETGKSGEQSARPTIGVKFAINKSATSALSVSDSGSVKEIFVDGLAGTNFANSVVKINLYSDTLNSETGATQRQVVVRLVMTAYTAQFLAVTLGATVDHLKGERLIGPLPEINLE